MGSWVRRVLALGALLAALAVFPSAVALAETTSPTPPASSAPVTAPPATPLPTTTADVPAEDDDDLPDVPLDDTRTVLALVGAGVLAVAAGIVVFLRR